MGIDLWQCTHGNAAAVRHQTVHIMVQYPSLSHYPDSELTSHCVTLLMLRARLGSDKFQCYKSLVFVVRWWQLLVFFCMGCLCVSMW